jgi:RNA polymerase sigma-70 factor (ECF subfamily)
MWVVSQAWAARLRGQGRGCCETASANVGNALERPAHPVSYYARDKVMENEPMNRIDDLIPTRRTLLSRLKDWNDQENWQLFFDTYWRLIYRSAIKGGLTEVEAQDAVQETVISVMKRIQTFKYDPKKGSFKTWLLILTRWQVVALLRKRDPILASENEPADSSVVSELEASWDREWETNLLEAATERVKNKADPKHYQMFDLIVFRKWPVSKVARLLRTNRARVYLAKHRISQQIKKEITRLRTKPL